MAQASRWKGILVPVVAFLLADFLGFIFLFFWDLSNDNDTARRYIYFFIHFISYAFPIAWYLKKHASGNLKEEFSKKWCLVLIPFYNSVLFFKAASHNREARNCSIAFGVSFILMQVCQIFPWVYLKNVLSEFEMRLFLSNNPTRDFINEFVYALFAITWIIFVFKWFAINPGEENKTEEREEDGYRKIYLKQISESKGFDNPVIWICLTVGCFVISFYDVAGYYFTLAAFYIPHDQFTLWEIFYGLWSSSWKLAGMVFLIIFIYKTWSILFSLNIKESKSKAMLIWGWFIPIYLAYWYYACFTNWRKPFENGIKNLQFQFVKNPEKKILRLAAFASVFYFFHIILWQLFRTLEYLFIMESPDVTNGRLIFYFFYGIFANNGFCLTLMIVALTAFILHVDELQKSLKKSAREKMLGTNY